MANTKPSKIIRGAIIVGDPIFTKLLDSEFESGKFLERQRIAKMIVEDLHYDKREGVWYMYDKDYKKYEEMKK